MTFGAILTLILLAGKFLLDKPWSLFQCFLPTIIELSLYVFGFVCFLVLYVVSKRKT